VCTYSKCTSNFLCPDCIFNHDPQHLNRFIVINNFHVNDTLEYKTNKESEEVLQILNENIKEIEEYDMTQKNNINECTIIDIG
jgi:hypothetical protein